MWLRPPHSFKPILAKAKPIILAKTLFSQRSPMKVGGRLICDVPQHFHHAVAQLLFVVDLELLELVPAHSWLTAEAAGATQK